MKIVIPSVRDTGGTGWNLAHAINSVYPNGEHQAIDMTAQKSYINYPTICHMGDYTPSTCRHMIEKADTIVFLGSFRPLFDGLGLDPDVLAEKRKLLLFMGSEWRNGRKELLEHVDKYIRGPYRIAVGSPCMMLPGEDEDKTPSPTGVEWLPLTRAIDEIARTYSMCNQDKHALAQFVPERGKVVFTHAPTSEERKGSQTFYYAMTRAQQMVPNLIFSMVRGQPWINCLKALASSDLLFDQDPPFPETYGGISVEASIFKLPIVSRIDPYAIEFWKREAGLDSPIIQWTDDEDLLKKVYKLATEPELRRDFGEKTYEFMRSIHDEKPVVERFMRIVGEMA